MALPKLTQSDLDAADHYDDRHLNAEEIHTGDNLPAEPVIEVGDDTGDLAPDDTVELPAAPAPAPSAFAGVRKTTDNPRPPIVLLHGMEKRGKTSLALSFPNPFYITAGSEAAPQGVEADTVGPLATFEELLGWLRKLAKEPHGYKTVVLDSLSRIEPLVHDYVIRTMQMSDKQVHRAKTIEDFGWGKGYVQADIAWGQIATALTWLNRRRGMGVVCIAHAKVKNVKEPLTEGYDSYVIDLHGRAVDLFKRESDAILFLRENLSVTTEQEGQAKRKRGTGGRLIFAHTSSAAAYTGGTRYRMPEKVLVSEDHGYRDLVENGFPRW